MTQGLKYDSGKSRLDLLSTPWIVGVGHVLRYGADKYTKDGVSGANNWRKGIARSKLLGSCLRHIFAYMGGEDIDKESLLPHLHHASACLMFMSELHETMPETDDRYLVTSTTHLGGE